MIVRSATNTLCSRIIVKNFKSIGTIDLNLSGMTIVTGRNGSGKSNFVDAFRFLVQSTQTSLESSIRARHGIDRVRRHSSGHPFNFGIRIDLNLSNIPRASRGEAPESAVYAFEVSSGTNSSFSVNREQLIISMNDGSTIGFDRKKDKINQIGKPVISYIENNKSSNSVVPDDSLFFTTVSRFYNFYSVARALSNVEIYSIDPHAIRSYQSHDAGENLASDGSNLASVIKRMQREKNRSLERILSFVKSIYPSTVDIGCEKTGASDILYIDIESTTKKAPFRIYPSNISDGTLRAIAILVGVFARPERSQGGRMVIVEEPESALHPGAASVLMDALIGLSRHNQVLITTHSPPLLDHPETPPDSVVGVSMVNGKTIMHGIDQSAREALSESLYTAGELLMKEKLLPNIEDISDDMDVRNLFVKKSRSKPARNEDVI